MQGRHAVASFLTRGGCYISWERGAEVFEEWLIDHEAACNIGNWQWLSCTAFYAMFYRVYSPVAFPQKWDKSGAFVRHYVPELANYPDKYIYEPWKAPIAGQRKAGCLIKTVNDHGEDEGKEEGGMKTYPKPIFDFAARRAICLDGMKSAYHINIYGDNPKVVDGTWPSLFPDGAEGPTTGKKVRVALREAGEPKKDGVDAVDDGTVEEDERGAADVGEEGEKTGGKRAKGREKGQGTLDGHVKKAKTAKA